MSELFVRVTDAFRYQPFRLVNGRYRRDAGPTFGTPREAIDYAKAADAATSLAPGSPPPGSGADSPDQPATRTAQLDFALESAPGSQRRAARLGSPVGVVTAPDGG